MNKENIHREEVSCSAFLVLVLPCGIPTCLSDYPENTLIGQAANIALSISPKFEEKKKKELRNLVTSFCSLFIQGQYMELLAS